MSTNNIGLLRNKKNIMWIPPLICSYVSVRGDSDDGQHIFMEELENKISVLNCKIYCHLLFMQAINL